MWFWARFAKVPSRRKGEKVMQCRVTIASIFLVTACVGLFPQSRAIEFSSSSPSLAKTEVEKKILAVLDEIVKSHRTYLSVPMQDGKVLRLFAEAIDAKNVVEIGTSTGYSGLWFCLALHKTGGHLTTFEIDHQRASMAREHFKQAGVEKRVTVVEGDAHEQVAN
jgi:predicted O-methyltransferase YrrM